MSEQKHKYKPDFGPIGTFSCGDLVQDGQFLPIGYRVEFDGKSVDFSQDAELSAEANGEALTGEERLVIEHPEGSSVARLTYECNLSEPDGNWIRGGVQIDLSTSTCSPAKGATICRVVKNTLHNKAAHDQQKTEARKALWSSVITYVLILLFFALCFVLITWLKD